MPYRIDRSWKTAEKKCLYCNQPLILHSRKDIKRKKFCSYSCRSRFHPKPRKSQADFEKEVKEIHGDSVTVLGRYQHNKAKILVRHNLCGEEYKIIAGQLLQNGCCKKCQYIKTRSLWARSKIDFEILVKEKHGNDFEVLDSYVNANKKILVRHKCGIEFDVRARSLLENKIICPRCRYDRLRSKDPKISRLVKNLRSQIIHVLRGRVKSAHTLELIGCSREAFKIYLENLWQPGMNWENYGKEWVVDHIRPCASFDDISLKEQQKECFNYKNTKPLWKFENMRKGSFYGGYRYICGKKVIDVSVS